MKRCRGGLLYVAMNTTTKDRQSRILFYMGRVCKLKCTTAKSGFMLVIWYWPKPITAQDDLDMWTHRYENCTKWTGYSLVLN